ncbi:hypothetical protein [Parasphingorhabdus sp.]|uniref:hypothetical protein n=1 Tax=Parasphingorhabdus sp. TaxID=2709688 RepID=UPI00359309D5
MSKEQTVTIQRKLDRLRAESLSTFRLEQRLTTSADDHVSYTEATIRQLARDANENLRNLVQRMTAEFPEANLSKQSFKLVQSGMQSHLANLEKEIELGRGRPTHPSLFKTIDDRFRLIRDELNLVLRQLCEISAVDDGVNTKSAKSPAGRKQSYNWSEASTAIWGQIYRGELMPNKQADIEKALIEFLRSGDTEPGESTVRPFARIIWKEAQREAGN